MHLSQIDLNLFVVLDEIYREGNITRASRQLSLTQPAISHALKRLRQLLNDPLFVRKGSNMVPTPFTRTIIGQVRQALQILEVNLYENRQFDPVHTRRIFYLGLRDSSESIVLPSLVRRSAEPARAHVHAPRRRPRLVSMDDPKCRACDDRHATRADGVRNMRTSQAF